MVVSAASAKTGLSESSRGDAGIPPRRVADSLAWGVGRGVVDEAGLELIEDFRRAEVFDCVVGVDPLLKELQSLEGVRFGGELAFYPGEPCLQRSVVTGRPGRRFTRAVR